MHLIFPKIKFFKLNNKQATLMLKEAGIRHAL
jgi:hypothetical protein